MQTKLRIGIDCRLAGKQHAGIGRYIENLVKRLPIDVNIQWVLFFHDQAQADEILNPSLVRQPAEERNSDFSASKTREVRLIPIRHYSLTEQIKLPKIFKEANLDLLHVPHFNIPIFYTGKLIVTIHDLLWHEQKGTNVTTLPKWQYWLKYLAYKFVAKQAILKAEKIIVPSETIKNTLVNYYPGANKKILVIKEGVDKKFLPAQAGENSPKGGPRSAGKNLLYVGSLYPHKNLKLVFQALKNLPNYKLNIISTRNVFTDNARHKVLELGIKDQVKFCGYVSDDELIKFYQDSFALLQPSLSEGFGLTGIEAMTVGCPVLASQIPVFKEIYDEAAIYFDPKSPESFISAIKKLETADREKIIKKGRNQAGQYSWETMMTKILDIYKQLCPKSH